jgi:hypothetical protein
LQPTWTNQQQVLGFAMAFASLSILCKNVGTIHFAEPNQHALIFFIQNLLYSALVELLLRNNLGENL